MDKIKLIVGLGNPGPEYSQTRHNVGTWLVSQLADHYQHPLKPNAKFFGYTSDIVINNHEIKLLVPATYMNLSGKAVCAIASFYKIFPEEMLIVHDELDLPPGVAKIKFSGGTGGHNGLKDIKNKLANQENFYRLRIGIGHPGDKNKVTGYVLGKPPKAEFEKIESIIDKSIWCLKIWYKDNLTKAINELHASKY